MTHSKNGIYDVKHSTMITGKYAVKGGRRRTRWRDFFKCTEKEIGREENR